MKKLVLLALAAITMVSLAACKPTTDETLYYTVTFETDGGT